MENEDYVKANYPGLYEAIQEYNSTTHDSYALFIKGAESMPKPFVGNLVAQNKNLIDKTDSILMMVFSEDQGEAVIEQQVEPYGIKNLRKNTGLGHLHLAWCEIFSDLLAKVEYSNGKVDHYERARRIVREQLSNLERGN